MFLSPPPHYTVMFSFTIVSQRHLFPFVIVSFYPLFPFANYFLPSPLVHFLMSNGWKREKKVPCVARTFITTNKIKAWLKSQPWSLPLSASTMRFLLLQLFLATLLLFSSFSFTLSHEQDEDEDLIYLQGLEGTPSPSHHDDFSDYKPPEVDHKDVVVLKENNFTDIVNNNRFVMVQFYAPAPTCRLCEVVAPDYAAAATELKDQNVILATVDDNALAHQFNVQAFPTLHFFIDGVHYQPFQGSLSKDAIVTWIKKKIGPSLIRNVTTLEEAQRILTDQPRLVLGFLNSLVGPESEELAAAARLEEDVIFYQTVNPDVAKLLHIDPDVKRPALILIKKEEEKLNHFDGPFVKSAIADFVFSNKLPLVTVFNSKSAPSLFQNAVDRHLLLFATSNESAKLIPVFQEAAKSFKGKLIFIYVETDNKDVGTAMVDYFGISNTGSGPKVLAFTGFFDGKKFLLDGELTVDKIKAFGEDFLEDKLKRFFKSDPIPKSNDGDVKIVVGKNFEEIVLDESKDVLLEIYSPWCEHCLTLVPIYNKLAKHLRGIDSLVIAKMNGITNEHPMAKTNGYPTLLFFPAGNKSSDPISFDEDRTVVDFYKFLKKHASIPFKLQKATSTSDAISDVKDEL
ncbi:hypothetical protein RJT34_28561 [Clitoria ternatea]|uniref:protein disulfide-isomerase n=1 Tax=Clitoria ternatea TaxID=43366 RepID=A0AAN9IBL0_CLITE